MGNGELVVEEVVVLVLVIHVADAVLDVLLDAGLLCQIGDWLVLFVLLALLGLALLRD
jgi:hypothetical protein